MVTLTCKIKTNKQNQKNPRNGYFCWWKKKKRRFLHHNVFKAEADNTDVITDQEPFKWCDFRALSVLRPHLGTWTPMNYGREDCNCQRRTIPRDNVDRYSEMVVTRPWLKQNLANVILIQAGNGDARTHFNRWSNCKVCATSAFPRGFHKYVTNSTNDMTCWPSFQRVVLKKPSPVLQYFTSSSFF